MADKDTEDTSTEDTSEDMSPAEDSSSGGAEGNGADGQPEAADEPVGGGTAPSDETGSEDSEQAEAQEPSGEARAEASGGEGSAEASGGESPDAGAQSSRRRMLKAAGIAVGAVVACAAAIAGAVWAVVAITDDDDGRAVDYAAPLFRDGGRDGGYSKDGYRKDGLRGGEYRKDGDRGGKDGDRGGKDGYGKSGSEPGWRAEGYKNGLEGRERLERWDEAKREMLERWEQAKRDMQELLERERKDWEEFDGSVEPDLMPPFFRFDVEPWFDGGPRLGQEWPFEGGPRSGEGGDRGFRFGDGDRRWSFCINVNGEAVCFDDPELLEDLDGQGEGGEPEDLEELEDLGDLMELLQQFGLEELLNELLEDFLSDSAPDDGAPSDEPASIGA